MNTIFNHVCVLVAAAFALTLVPEFRNLKRSLLSRRDQGAVLLVFTILGLVEEATVSPAGLLNERIVAVCAAGLVEGPWVGLAVSVFVTWLAVAHHGLPLGAITTSMLGGGLAGGWLCRWRPKLAQHPVTGFGLTFGVSWLGSGFLFWAPYPAPILHRLEEIAIAAVLQGLGTALILAIIDQVRDRDEQSRAAASDRGACPASPHESSLFVQCSEYVCAFEDRSTRSPGVRWVACANFYGPVSINTSDCS
jgi:LytS/YehU family sensor histidine kinase